VIVVDASAAVSGLLRAGPARRRIATESLHAPHLIDSEVTDALRKLAMRRAVTQDEAAGALGAWRRIGLRRYPSIGLIDRIWGLRHDVSAYDAAYVALAEALDCSLLAG
jgi:predicted nucleic acid-binding protein